MKKENLLIVCFDVKDLNSIDKIDLSNYRKIIIASDDFRVHEECKKLEFAYGISFLQRPIPYTTVVDDVVQIIDKSNLFYKEVEEKFKLLKKYRICYFI
jgi:hypothetical protein